MAEENTPNQPPEPPEHSAEDKMSSAGSHMAAGARDAMSGARDAISQAGLREEGPSLATAALVGVGVAIIEPELIPGLLIGAGAALAPRMLPAIGGLLRPAVKGVVKVGYSATMAVRQAFAEVNEQVEDIVAEVRAEEEHEPHDVATTAVGTDGGQKRKRRQRPSSVVVPAPSEV